MKGTRVTWPVIRPPANRAHGRPAFTLIEVLVIVAIIVLLLSLTVSWLAVGLESSRVGPGASRSLRRARLEQSAASRSLRRARLEQCISNLHQMGVAAAAYAADNNAYVPRAAHPTEVARYQFAACLSPYINGKTCTDAEKQNWPFVYQFLKGEEVFLCPAVDQTTSGGEPYVLNYITNGHDHAYYSKTGQYHAQGAPASRLMDLPRSPGEILYIVEFNPAYYEPKSFTVYDVFRWHHMPFDGLTPNGSPRMIRADDTRHDGKTTILHFDASAETCKLDPYEIPVTLWNPDEPNHRPPPR